MTGTRTLRVVSSSCNCSCSIVRSAFKPIGAIDSSKNASMSLDEVFSGFGIGGGSSEISSGRVSLNETLFFFDKGVRSKCNGESGTSTLRSSKDALRGGGEEGISLISLSGL